jgi:hypothetical protein
MFQIYPGAYHGFDAPDMPIHTVENYRKGGWAPIEGTNLQVRENARNRVGRFLAEHIGSKAAQQRRLDHAGRRWLENPVCRNFVRPLAVESANFKGRP